PRGGGIGRDTDPRYSTSSPTMMIRIGHIYGSMAQVKGMCSLAKKNAPTKIRMNQPIPEKPCLAPTRKPMAIRRTGQVSSQWGRKKKSSLSSRISVPTAIMTMPTNFLLSLCGWRPLSFVVVFMCVDDSRNLDRQGPPAIGFRAVEGVDR